MLFIKYHMLGVLIEHVACLKHKKKKSEHDRKPFVRMSHTCMELQLRVTETFQV